MALTREIIETSSDHLDNVAKLIVVSLVRELKEYQCHANIFNTRLDAAINSAEGTIKARQINGILREIENLGIGEVEIRGDRDGLWWSQMRERDALVRMLFNTLFDFGAEVGSGTGKTVVKDKGVYGVAAIGQRPCFHASPCYKCS